MNDDNGDIPTTDADVGLWSRIRAENTIGDAVTGAVICRRPFGVFIDFGYGASAPALLLVSEMANPRSHRLDFDDYPRIGDSVSARIVHVDWDRRKIALTQNQTFDSVTATWRKT